MNNFDFKEKIKLFIKGKGKNERNLKNQRNFSQQKYRRNDNENKKN